MKTVDARGLSCPQPLILTKQALTSAPDELVVLVDSGAARENVSRLARNQGYNVTVEMDGDEATLTLKKV